MIRSRFDDYLTLCKPKVVLMMLITAWIGMHLATPSYVPISILILATIGIAFASSSAAIINHILDRHLDAKMTRTQHRPMATQRISLKNAIIFSSLLGIIGVGILYFYVNQLTAVLTLATLFSYALIYTGFLKRLTPQNIVIGGIAGAMPPLLGWTAVSGELNALAWLPVLIIFAWTPPHFWALAIAKKEDYEKANIPMLPNTHGITFTKVHIMLYVLLLISTTLLPYSTHLSGIFYLLMATALNLAFLWQVFRLFRSPTKIIAYSTFRFSILYLLLLFVVMLVDHYLPKS